MRNGISSIVATVGLTVGSVLATGSSAADAAHATPRCSEATSVSAQTYDCDLSPEDATKVNTEMTPTGCAYFGNPLAELNRAACGAKAYAETHRGLTPAGYSVHCVAFDDGRVIGFRLVRGVTRIA